MNPTTSSLNRMTCVLAASHFVMALVTALDRAGFGRRADGVIPAMADNPGWVALHLIAALLILESIAVERSRRIAAAWSMGVFFSWSALMGIWALQLDPDATWSVTILGMAMAAGSWAVSGFWADRE